MTTRNYRQFPYTCQQCGFDIFTEPVNDEEICSWCVAKIAAQKQEMIIHKEVNKRNKAIRERGRIRNRT